MIKYGDKLIVKTEIGYLMIESNIIKSPHLVCHDHNELQRMIMTVMVSIKNWSMCGFDVCCSSLKMWTGVDIQKTTMEKACLLQLMLRLWRWFSLLANMHFNKKKPSFQKNLEKIMIYGDESDDNEKFLVMKDDESEESLPRPLENSKMVMI